ncbi:hypothetical protein BDV40DRAFT_282468 [Aspergillus tamarii]|uniref:Uncharacterized protein n=1 Tax=Aspergillus tamarii TaxID=41984 RepID=A0A5N6UBL6_ASPTM|nr:hypothetical protein BDV40DRAFT_282468 [Aspergillus tamarii]
MFLWHCQWRFSIFFFPLCFFTLILFRHADFRTYHMIPVISTGGKADCKLTEMTSSPNFFSPK